MSLRAARVRSGRVGYGQVLALVYPPQTTNEDAIKGRSRGHTEGTRLQGGQGDVATNRHHCKFIKKQIEKVKQANSELSLFDK
jgi:hypothetical protein